SVMRVEVDRAACFLTRGRWDAAIAASERAGALARELGLDPWFVGLPGASARAQRGEAAEALAWVDANVPAFARDAIPRPLSGAIRAAEIWIEAGRLDQAEQIATWL